MNEEFFEQYKALKTNYINSLADKFDFIDSVESELRNNNINLENLEKLYQLSHKISGTSGVYGIVELSTPARELELLLKTALKEESDKLFENRILVENIISLINKLKTVYAEVKTIQDEQ